MSATEQSQFTHTSRLKGLGIFLFAATGLVLGALLAIIS